MLNYIKTFLTSEDGAISVEWVVLTAGVVGLAGASAVLINDGVVSAATHIETGVQAQQVGVVN